MVRGDAADDGAMSAGAQGAALGRQRFDRVVFDTAPTGHTLRLLAFPEFLDNLLSKLVKLRARLGGAIALLGGLLGGVDPAAKMDRAVERLERWRSRVSELQRLLTDPEVTDFVVVGIATRLSVAECARLLSALAEQGVPVNHIVVNQLVDANAPATYIERVAAEQTRALRSVESGASPLASLALSRVPYFSMEMRGVYPLKFYAQQAYGCGAPGLENEQWADLFDDPSDRFILVGGKGGVGKTTSSAALAVQTHHRRPNPRATDDRTRAPPTIGLRHSLHTHPPMRALERPAMLLLTRGFFVQVGCAEAGHNTLVVSTDPAHSLGDAFDLDLSSGDVVRVEGITDASLYAVEIKVDDAVADFKRSADLDQRVGTQRARLSPSEPD